MAAPPNPRSRTPAARARLVPFDPQFANRLVTWPTTPEETYWLAPKTPPPLTLQEIRRWATPGHEPFMLLAPDREVPVAYGELNRLTGYRRRYWLGHLVVDPAFRGQGYGVALVRSLVREAFAKRGAQQVTLVVFPANERAIACYHAAGFHDDGYETHDFPAYRTRELLLRMATGQAY